jgi:hypothetical protein
MRTHNQEELTELSRALRENVLPTLRTQNVRVNVPATPKQVPAASQQPVPATPVQAPDAQQRPDAQAIAPAATPAQGVQPGQQQHPSPTQALVTNTTHQRNLYDSIVTQGQQVPSRNRLSYTGPPPSFFVPGTPPRVSSVSATMGNKPMYTHRPLYAFQSFQSATTPVRSHGYGYQTLPRNTGHYATAHPTPTAANVNLPGYTGQTDPQLTPQQQAAVYIGDAAAPTLPHGALAGEDGSVIFTYVLTEVMGCDQVLSTIFNLDGINTIHNVLALPPQYSSNG